MIKSSIEYTTLVCLVAKGEGLFEQAPQLALAPMGLETCSNGAQKLRCCVQRPGRCAASPL